MSPDPRFQSISGLAPDDLTYALALTYNSLPLDLSTITSVTAYLKASQDTPDTQAKTYTVGTGLVITSSPQGQLTWSIPQADTAGKGWYRIGVVDGTGHKVTAKYGPFTLSNA